MSAPAHPAASSITTNALAAELRAIFTGAAVAPITDRAFLRITGPDATRWLNGMVTNAINALAPGEGCYNFLLNAQGRILGDCTIYRTFFPGLPAYVLSTSSDQVEAIREHLDKFIIMDDVELRPFTEQGLLVLGPKASEILHKLGLKDIAPLAFTQMDSKLCEVMMTAPSQGLVPQFELYPPGDEAICIPELQEAAGVSPVSPAALEALRILSGSPKYGVDIRNTDRAHDLPQETAQDRALHFSKGCYLGQEIVERIRSRGSVHRTFTGFILHGDLPAAGAELTTESQPRPVGQLTSVIVIPHAALDPGAAVDSPPLQYGLGYIRREALDRTLRLTYPGGTATPASLPFQLP